MGSYGIANSNGVFNADGGQLRCTIIGAGSVCNIPEDVMIVSS